MREVHFWQSPILMLAAVLGLAGAGAGIRVLVEPDAVWAAIQWGLAGACVTLAIADWIHTGRLDSDRFKVLLLGASVFALQFVLLGAAVVIGAVILLAIGEELLDELF